jgi:hypothetical protein
MEKTDTRALLSLITGVAAVMFMFAMDRLLFHTASVVLGVAAVWTGTQVMREGKKGMGLSVAGIVLGTIAVCAWIITKIYG